MVRRVVEGKQMVEFIGEASVRPSTQTGTHDFASERLNRPATTTVGHALEMADDLGCIRLDFSSRERRDFAKFSDVDDLAAQIIARGYVEVDVDHLRCLPAATPIWLGYEVNYSYEEAGLLESDQDY